MPRKDRRFTAEDVARFYCLNLSPPQREIVRVLITECGDPGVPGEQTLARLLRVFADLSDTAGVPVLGESLRILADVVESPDERHLREMRDAMGLVGPPSS